MKTALLLSGGMDSTALAFWKKPELAITVDYGQTCARGEIRAAQQVCRELNIEHEVLHVQTGELGSGDLAGLPPLKVAPVREWWPFRNQLLVTVAAMRAVAVGVTEIMVGSVQTDGVHIDGTLNFYNALDLVLSMQEGGVRVSAPAISMNSDELISMSGINIELLSWAHSCHLSEFACGSCRGCNKHRAVMHRIGYEWY